MNPSTNCANTSRASRAERGSILIVSMLLAAVIGISLVSYIRLTTNSLKQASRSLYNISAMNFAEIGLEQAMYSFNQMDSSTVAAAWSGWTISGINATRTLSGFAPGPGATASVKVYVQNYDGSDLHPIVVSKSTITLSEGPPISKYIEVTLRHRSTWSWGLVAKDSIRMIGNATVDSWNSDPDNNPATPPVGYSAAVRRDGGSAGVVSPTNGALSLSPTASIYGTALTGGGTVATAAGARIYGAASPGNPLIDPSRVKTDFSFTFPAIPVPTPSVTNSIGASITTNTTFPRPGDVAASDGKYYYNFVSGKVIDAGDTFNLLTINRPTVFIFANHVGINTIHANGNLRISIATTASLNIYTNGNILLESADRINYGNPPLSLMIYGTNPNAQTFSVPGNIELCAMINAPTAYVNISGSPCNLYGAVIAKSIDLTSSGFHYDEALANLGGANPYGLTKWRELQSDSERAVYATQLNF